MVRRTVRASRRQACVDPHRAEPAPGAAAALGRHAGLAGDRRERCRGMDGRRRLRCRAPRPPISMATKLFLVVVDPGDAGGRWRRDVGPGAGRRCQSSRRHERMTAMPPLRQLIALPQRLLVGRGGELSAEILTFATAANADAGQWHPKAWRLRVVAQARNASPPLVASRQAIAAARKPRRAAAALLHVPRRLNKPALKRRCFLAPPGEMLEAFFGRCVQRLVGRRAFDLAIRQQTHEDRERQQIWPQVERGATSKPSAMVQRAAGSSMRRVLLPRAFWRNRVGRFCFVVGSLLRSFNGDEIGVLVLPLPCLRRGLSRRVFIHGGILPHAQTGSRGFSGRFRLAAVPRRELRCKRRLEGLGSRQSPSARESGRRRRRRRTAWRRCPNGGLGPHRAVGIERARWSAACRRRIRAVPRATAAA